MPDLLDQASQQTVISVAELNRLARTAIERGVPLLWVAGEISNFKRYDSGHCYFTLKDEAAQVDAVMFRQKAQYLEWTPENGMQVEVRATATVYEARGKFQLVVDAMRRAGLGALYAAFEKLKAKLEKEGLFDVALKRERSPAEYRETLVRCRDEVVLLSRLAADLLTLARTDAGLPLEHREEVDLLTLVHVVAERFVTVAAERGIRIVADGEPAVVTGDALALERAVSNLVDNAIKHSGRGGFVTLRVDRTDPATVTVSDDGVGVAAHQVSQLFMRFFRGDPARPRDTGYGLGLAIARAAAESHGGTLQYLGNAPGAVFRLTLPNAT